MKTGRIFIYVFLLTLIVLSGGTLNVLAQKNNSLKVLVKVLDSNDNTPLPYSYVKDLQSKMIYNTGAKGEVYLSVNHLPMRIEVSYVGYETKQFNIPVQTGTFTCSLRNIATNLSSVQVLGEKRLYNKTTNIEIVSKAKLSQQQELSMASLLTSLPGLRVLSTGALIEKPIIEGMSGSRIAIIDNQSKLVGQHWGDDHAPELSIPSYADVSVEKGAKSVKYGSNAIGGIIVVNTDLNPDDKANHLLAHTSYSTNGQMYGGNGYWESSPVKGFRYRIGTKYYRGGSYSTADYLLYNTGSKLLNENVDLAFRRNKWLINTHLTYYDAEMGIFTGSHIGSKDDLLRRFEQGRPGPDEIGDFSYKIGSPKQRVQHFTGGAHVSWSPQEQNQYNWRWTYQMDYRREYEIRRGNYINTPSFAFKLYSNNLHFDWTHHFSPADYFEVGVNALAAENVSDGNTKAVPIIPNYNSFEGGIYGILIKQLNSRLTGEAGVRSDWKYVNSKGYDWVGKFYSGKRNFFSLTGSVGLKYKINNGSNFHFNLGLAWRAPEVNELYSKGVHHGDAIYQEGDPNLSTEQALKLTAGYHLRRGVVDFKIHGFLHYIHNYIYDVPNYETVDGEKRLEVVEQLSGTFPKYYYKQSNGLFAGGDASCSINLLSGLTYTLSGEWIRARNLSLNSYFPDIPADRYKQKLDYSLQIDHSWNLTLNMEHQLVCKQTHFDPDIDLLPQTPPSYSLLGGGLSLLHNWKDQKIEFYVRGTNLLNKLYKDYTNRMRYFAHDKGRDITLGVKYSF